MSTHLLLIYFIELFILIHLTRYGGVDSLMVPSEHIWLPDIVLYNK